MQWLEMKKERGTWITKFNKLRI